jgi:NADH:ubiquinone oxidoreductase subunit 6 (subunit J)
MKSAAFYVALVLTAAMFAGCASLLTKTPPATSVTVTSGAATTNTPEAVAWLQLAQQVNEKGNPTPSEAPIAAVIGGLIAIVGSVATAYNHRANASALAQTTNTPTTTKT